MTVASTSAPDWPFDNSYARLPERFFARVAPTPVGEPQLLRMNPCLAAELGLDAASLESPNGLAILSGNTLPGGAEPLAMAYAGFQFGSWVPQLGDGRAILLGELRDRQGERRDVQLKGSGPTPFSRRGDGRAGLGPVLREYVVSEAMFALGIPTTRSLAAVTTGEQIARERMIPGAVLTRVARSHVRIGTFQYFAGQRDVDGIRTLADYVIERHYPEAANGDVPYLSLFQRILERQAELIARWQGVGFIHGVMNTDNMSVVGETIDYGPCAFMDGYHPETVYSSIDHGGRYAYDNQPPIAHWNLASFAQALLPILGEDERAAIESVQSALERFPVCFEAAHRQVFGRKLGLDSQRSGDQALVDDLLALMSECKADFTLTFRRLCDAFERGRSGDDSVRALFDDPASFDDWARRWRARLAEEVASSADRARTMRSSNPAYIPRNHLVEEAIQAAEQEGDLAPFETLVEVLASPFEDQPGRERYEVPPRPEQVVHQTFCGT